MRVIVAVPFWNDGVDLLRGCFESAVNAGLDVVALDGSYATYSPDGEHRTPSLQVVRAMSGLASSVTIFPAPRRWEHEAEKRTALARIAIDVGADWIFFLDADERIEALPGDVAMWLSQPEQTGFIWADVDIYQPATAPHSSWRVPRLIKAISGLRFDPPRDFYVMAPLFIADQVTQKTRSWVDTRIAYLEGEQAPRMLQDRHAKVPGSLLRIRHDRHLRTLERVEMSARYVNQRRELHGVN